MDSSGKSTRKKYSSFKGLARQLSIRSLKPSTSSSAVDTNEGHLNEIQNSDATQNVNSQQNSEQSFANYQQYSISEKRDFESRNDFRKPVGRSTSLKQNLTLLQRQDSQETTIPSTPPAYEEDEQYANQTLLYSDFGYYTDKRRGKYSLSSLPPDLPPPRSNSQTFSTSLISPVSPGVPQKSILVSSGSASTRSQRRGILQRSPSATTPSKRPEFMLEASPPNSLINKQNAFFPVNPSVSPSIQRMSWSRDSPRQLPNQDSQEMSARFLTVDQGQSGNNSLVHQRSSESHDSTTSYVSMASGASMGYASGSENEVSSNQNSIRFEMPEPAQQPAPVTASSESSSSQTQMWRSAFTNLKQKRGSLFKKKSKPVNEIDEIDPIYQLLKCASNFNGQTCGVCNRGKIIPVGPNCKPECTVERHWCDTCKCPCHTTVSDPSKGLGTTARDLVGTQARQALDRSRTLSPSSSKPSKR